MASDWYVVQLLVFTALMFLPATAFAEPDEAIPTIVIQATPLPMLGLDPKTFPAPVQTVRAEQFARAQALDVSQFIRQNLGSVNVNDTQNNPFQPDITFRGFSASPLLGTPEGLSLYMDGVRLNQPFGDVVSWDLVPRAAVRAVTLMPGSNPLFGLNTLGGALSIQTKDGRSDPGTTIQGLYGSYDRMSADLTHGGSAGAFDWFAAGTYFKEDGWRDASPTAVRQVFGKLGWEDNGTRLKLSAAYFENDLTGNGLQEQRFLARNYASVYTPDETHNLAKSLNFEAEHRFSKTLLVSGNAYYRNIRTRTFNGDVNDNSLDQSLYQPNAAERAALTQAGYTGFPTSGENAATAPFPKWRCIAQALLRDEPGEKCNGIINQTRAAQDNYGAAVQASLAGEFGGAAHVLTAGAAFDGSGVDFGQLSQLGYLLPDHTVQGVGAFGDGVTGGNIDGAPFDTRVDLGSTLRTVSVFATDTLALLSDTLNITASGRYNRSTVHNRDRIHTITAPDTLTADHRFQRFNPAIGFAYAPIHEVTGYAGYNEGSRAPSAVELGCANPLQPCKLPNAFAGDPPLKQVVTRTIEAGFRGDVGASFSWSAGVFRATNKNDILFVADNAAGSGYFKNFGKTRRQGFEAAANGTFRRLEVGANYTFLDATFRSPETIDGTGNSTNDEALAGRRGFEGTIDIAPGNRIPLTPRHVFKFHADYEVIQGLSLGVETFTSAGAYARGNENNQHQPDGTVYLGPGKIDGYTTLALHAQYQVRAGWNLFMRIDNLLDTHYLTAAVLGGAGFNAAGNFQARQLPAVAGEFPVPQATFYAPGAPRLISGGIKVTF
jgi:outer membrane receptor protein involved in Fe transport